METMKTWWMTIWEGEDLSEMLVIVGLMGLAVICLLQEPPMKDLAAMIAGGFARHLMGAKKKNGNGQGGSSPQK